ncbi:formylglycine-generating enzyme family protein [Jannaschia pohangensis]|uniref:Formylglycine-generating enzyme, required for sulfatase activity, contains SUMF1/FGE domain n=1 Tax=Jannaschia pohangensis TaxID=390807 RepID=A0A1I3IWZ9_9RHOB|nr:SUMF1/EgtB/PvdO family nonheme iron enzyme [Jannaschia pohangensis]SFI52385.1 Formylglycine-generating enzyme, required for sulfatase activity, contains SUMF1/FGE domain [Jannaschia pohangensis]
MALAAANPRLPTRTILGAILGLAAALGIGVALTWRGPDRLPRPDMVAVSFTGPLWVQRHEVTVADWNRCAKAGACDRALNAPRGMDAVSTPATGVNHPEAMQYVEWISARTHHPYLLPDMAEWSAMARDVVRFGADPIFDQPELDWASAYLLDARKSRALMPSGAFSVSPEGVADLDGSVWEWTRDCHAGTAGPASLDRCSAYVVGGAHFAVMAWLERDPARGGCAVGTPPAHLGLRLVTHVEP